MSKSPAIIVRESKSLYKSLRTCLMYLGAPILGAYIFMIIDSCFCIDPFTIMECPSLFLLVFVTIKSILSETKVIAPVLFFFLLSV